MTIISKDTNRNNLGGNYRIQILLFHDLFKIKDAVNGIVQGFEIFNNTFILEIVCTIETIEDIIKKKRNRQGTIYEVDITGQIPKTRVEIRNQLEDLDSKKFVVLLFDNNGNIRLFGDLKNPMRFDDDIDRRGKKAANINAYEFSFTGQFTYRPYYVDPDFEPEYVSPVFQLIFETAVDETELVEDSTNINNDAHLQDAYCLSILKDGTITLPVDIDFTDYTLQHDGTAQLSLDIPNKIITATTAGTVYNLQLIGVQNYTFPCCEGDLDQLHDVERGERAWTALTSWVFQSQYFYMMLVGGDEIRSTTNTARRLFVPYNTSAAKIFNGKADNKWYAGIDYKVNMIVKYEGVYYYCNNAYTSSDWDLETANWTTF